MDAAPIPVGSGARFGPLHDADVDTEQLAALAETEALERVLEWLRRELGLAPNL